MLPLLSPGQWDYLKSLAFPSARGHPATKAHLEHSYFHFYANLIEFFISALFIKITQTPKYRDERSYIDAPCAADHSLNNNMYYNSYN